MENSINWIKNKQVGHVIDMSGIDHFDILPCENERIVAVIMASHSLEIVTGWYSSRLEFPKVNYNPSYFDSAYKMLIMDAGIYCDEPCRGSYRLAEIIAYIKASDFPFPS
jgi:hypothetical protein